MRIINSFILVSLLIAGCKSSDSDKKKEVQKEQIGAIVVQGERNYLPSEIEIGRRICQALKNKRQLFESLPDQQEQFRLRGEMKNCQSPSPYNIFEFNAFISNASSADFEYVSPRSIYFRDVITDQTSGLKTICENLATSDTVSNQILSGSSYLRYNFLISDGFDRFEVAKISKDASGNYKAVSTESVSIITQQNQANPKFFGVEKERVRYTPCSNPKEYSYTKQEWITAITPF